MKVKIKSIEQEEEPVVAARGQGWPVAILTDDTVSLFALARLLRAL